MEESKFHGALENVIGVTRDNNRMLGLQGETINQIDKKNDKIFNQVRQAEHQLQQMEYG
jgi:hypothetical protein